MRLDFEGFPTLGFTEKIELPPIAEIIRSPMFLRASIDDIYKHGGDFNKFLINNCPISGDYNEIAVTVDLKILSPKTMPMRTHDWHCDGSEGCPYFSFDEKQHIFVGYTDSVTEFLGEPASLDVPDSIKDINHFEFRKYIEANLHRIENMKPRNAPQQVFTTFHSKHLHRAPLAPDKPCFRLMVIVRESNFNQSMPYEKSLQKHSDVFHVADDKGFVNLEHGAKGIILRSLEVLGGRR